MEYFYFLKEVVNSGNTFSDETKLISDFMEDPFLDVEKYIELYDANFENTKLVLSYSKYNNLN